MNVPDSFSTTARYYAGRIAYSREFFEKLAHELQITRKSSVLDLACGGGELSFGLAPYAGSIAGIDASGAMLENATTTKTDNLSFHQRDLNKFVVATETKVDLVTIGRAIPYLNMVNLKKTLSASLKKDGTVIICGAVVAEQTPWLDAYEQVRKTVREAMANSDFQGLRVMPSIGFSYLGTIAQLTENRFSIDDMVNHSLSYRSQLPKILKDPDAFRASLEEALNPFKEADGQLTGSVMSWANVFRANGE